MFDPSQPIETRIADLHRDTKRMPLEDIRLKDTLQVSGPAE